MINFNVQKNSGQAMLITIIFFLVVSSSAVMGAVSPTARQAVAAQDLKKSHASYYLAESGVEDVVYRLKNNMQTSDTEVITLGGTTATTAITRTSGNNYTIETLGDTSSRQRKIQTSIATTNGFSFSYGVQVGAGGFDIGGNAGVIGNVYANGPILGENGSFITGTAISAGASGLIDGIDDVGENGIGDAYANTVNGVTVADKLYCQTGSGNNKTCDTSRTDPEPQNFPITDDDLLVWQTQAGVGTTIVGDYVIDSSVTALGPVIITGDLEIKNNADLTLFGTVWVQGNLKASNNVVISLDSSYEADGEAILVDGYAHLSNNVDFAGSGISGSYIMLVVNSSCPNDVNCDGNDAISLDNNVGTVILNAQNGTIFFRNNAGATAATAETIKLDNNATIIYEQGLIDVNFSSGPSGTFSVQSWGEV
ncbi:MAG: hypothetical protein OEX08_01595 [Candidatus Nomurabacteria bacterium]|nr:hypothetical protein [Candidatus Nomurabacteria bacterium]